jgi:hypothetical protein
MKIWPALTLAACAASPGHPTEVSVPLASSSRMVAPALPDIETECASAARCELDANETSTLGSEIEVAQKSVLDSGFADVHALVRLVKLQLRRNDDVPGNDGSSDAARAQKNAMRAVAVDDTSAEARLVLSMALARSLHQTTTTTDPLVRGLALDLIGLGLHDVRQRGEGAVRSGAEVLEKTIDRLRLHSAELPHLGREPLAPAPPPPPHCTSSEAAAAASASYCTGLDRLGASSSRADQEQAAGLVVDGWRTLTPLCQVQDPACPPHISAGLAAASRAFLSAGRPAKSIAAGLLILGNTRFPGAGALEPVVSLELGDRYYTLGVFDQAASWYERAAKLAQADPSPATRALQIRVALGDADAAMRLANELVRNAHHPLATRALWVVTVVHAVRAARGPRDAATWISTHQALFQQPLDADVREVALPLPTSDPTATGCDVLTCTVGHLARASW